MYGLAFAYMELGDIEQAQKHVQMVLDMSALEEELQEDGCKGARTATRMKAEALGIKGLQSQLSASRGRFSVRSVKI